MEIMGVDRPWPLARCRLAAELCSALASLGLDLLDGRRGGERRGVPGVPGRRRVVELNEGKGVAWNPGKPFPKLMEKLAFI